MDYYEENYPAYELQNSANKLGFYLSLIHASVPQGASVFEVGVGKGIFFQKAKEHFQIAGCDVNADGLEATRKRVTEAKLYLGSTETLKRYIAEVGKTPSAVVSWDVLEHLPDLTAGLRELYAQMAPGSALIGVVPVYDGPLGWLVRRLDKDPTHVTKTGRREWIQMLQTCGFRVDRWGGILRKLVFGKTYLHWTQPQWLLRAIGSAIYFVAIKPDPSGASGVN